jgi:hypothetical protein
MTRLCAILPSHARTLRRAAELVHDQVVRDLAEPRPDVATGGVAVRAADGLVGPGLLVRFLEGLDHNVLDFVLTDGVAVLGQSAEQILRMAGVEFRAGGPGGVQLVGPPAHPDQEVFVALGSDIVVGRYHGTWLRAARAAGPASLYGEA